MGDVSSHVHTQGRLNKWATLLAARDVVGEGYGWEWE